MFYFLLIMGITYFYIFIQEILKSKQTNGYVIKGSIRWLTQCQYNCMGLHVKMRQSA